jgi:hypothetical protein
MATEVRIPYAPRSEQKRLHEESRRWRVTICHRRFGKTVYAINRLIKDCLTCEERAPRFAYVAPFLTQAKAIAWDYLKFYSQPIPGIKIHESELRVEYPNGGRIRLFGSDKPHALRGLYLDGVVLDEYAQIHPALFPEVLRPALADRAGWAEFMGTPQGRNHFYEIAEHAKQADDWAHNVFRASETKILSQEELKAARAMMSEDAYMQEFECSFAAAAQGSYYHKLIEQLREDGKIAGVPVEPAKEVNTFWDLGRNDTTAIWFHQQVGKEHRFVDYYENSGEGLEHYARVLREKAAERGFLYGEHYLPHDVEVTDLSTPDNRSRRQILEDCGVSPIKVVPRITDVNEGIERVRQKLPTCWFDAEHCDQGIKALENYRKDYDDKNQTYRNRPLHDWASNGADAFRQFAQGYESGGQWAPMNYQTKWVV